MRELFLFLYKKANNFFAKRNAGRFPLVRAVNEFIVAHLVTNKVEINGHVMYLDEKDSLALSINKTFEPIETEIAVKEIKKGDTVIDLGANIGYYTLIFARLVGEKGKVYAFEPDKDNFKILKKNVEKNGYKNVILVNKAVSDKTGETKLYISPDNKADHRIYSSDEKRKYTTIKMVKLDDYFKKSNEKIHFIKLDIQGAEYSAVKGMQQLLKRSRKIKLVTEYSPIALKRFGIDPEEYLKLLHTSGFTFQEINERKWWLTDDVRKNNKDILPVTEKKLLKTYTPENGMATNLFCIK